MFVTLSASRLRNSHVVLLLFCLLPGYLVIYKVPPGRFNKVQNFDIMPSLVSDLRSTLQTPLSPVT